MNKLKKSFAIKLAASLWFITSCGMAQTCQVVLSRPEIDLGRQVAVADNETLFAQQQVTVTADCADSSPVTLFVEGAPDDSGRYFLFGRKGIIKLMLLSARYDDGAAALTVTTPLQAEQRIAAGQSVSLAPGSRISMPAALANDEKAHRLTLQLQLAFSAAGGETDTRDVTEMLSQIRFRAE